MKSVDLSVVRRRNLRRITRFFLVMMVFVSGFLQAHSQITITTPYPAAAQPLTRGGLDTSLLTVEVNFLSACTSNTVTITLPPGVQYVPGSVAKIAGNTGINIGDLGGTLNVPTFAITNVLAAGSITFTIQRTAGCGLASSGKDVVAVVGSCGNVTENNLSVNAYSLLSPALSITPPPALTDAVLGQMSTRTVSFTNGGNGCLDTAYYYVVYPAGGIVNAASGNAITANGVSFTPSSANGDTLFYKIYGASLFGGDRLLCNGETVTILENIKVVKCNTSTAYGVAWGHGNHCQVATAGSVMTMAAGVPNISASFNRVQELSWCQKGIYTITYSNGSGGNGGTAYNILANIGYTHLNATAVPEGLYPTVITRIDSFKIGGATVPMIPITATQPAKANFSGLMSDPDGAGIGLEDLDGDGQFDDLAPGQSVTITVYEHWEDNSISCPLQPYYIFGTHTLSYGTMCGTAATTNALSLTGSYRLGSVISSVVAPPEAEDGKPFTVQMCVELGALSRPNYKPKDSLYFDLVLPAGVSLSGSGNITYSGLAIAAANGSVTTSTNGGITTVHIMRKGADQRYCFTADLVYSCAAAGGGNFNLGISNYYIGDSCAVSRENYLCTTKTVKAVCNTPCPLGGVFNYTPQATRLSLGYADATMTTKVTPATVKGIAKFSGLPLDTFSIIVPGKEIIAAGSSSNLYYDLQLDKANGEEVLRYLSGTFYQYRGGSVISSSALAVPVDGGSTGTLQSMHWDASSNLFNGAIVDGDSVWLDIRVAVTKANNGQLYSTTLTQIPNISSSMYNLDGTTKLGCGMGHSFNMLVSGTAEQQATLGGANITNCSSQVATSGLYIGNTTTFDIFPDEFRPYAIADSILITLLSGYDMVANRYNTITWNSLVGYLTTPANTTGVVTQVSANQWVIKNPNLANGGWLIADLIANGAANYALAFDVVPTCAAATGSQVASIKWYYRTNAYAGAGNYVNRNLSGAGMLTYNAANKPAISVQNNTGTVQGVLPQHYWDVQINSAATSTAPNVWMALEKGVASGISVDSVVLKPSNVVVTPMSYGAGNTWYQLSAAGLAGGTHQQARIYFKYNNCTGDSIFMRSGWNCAGYPSEPVAYACSTAGQFLKVAPENSQVQISIDHQVAGGGTLDMCTADSVTIIVNSAQAANVNNPSVTIYPPEGIAITNPVEIEYPLGSGNWQTISPVTLSGGGYEFNLSVHTGIGVNGLPGTTVNPAPAGRQAKIKVPVSASCSFVSGSQLSFVVHGAKPCGGLASGDGLSVNTNPVNITGAISTGDAVLGMSLTGDNVIGCGQTAKLDFTVTQLGTTSVVGDTAVYTLPAGMSYVENSFTGCASCAVITVPGTSNRTLVKVALPVGLPSGTTTVYSLNAMPTGAGCGLSSVEGRVERSITGFSCGMTTCSSSRVIIGTGTPISIVLNKPALTITGLTKTNGALQPGQSVTLNVTITNTTDNVVAGSTYVVEFFCNDGDTPFTKALFPEAIGSNTSVAADMTLLIPTSPLCTEGEFITARIRPLTDEGVTQCLCSETAYTMNVPLPLQLTRFEGNAQGCSVVLNWQTVNEQQQSHFDIEYSPDGQHYQKIGSMICQNNITGSNYRFEHQMAEDRGYYRLKMAGMDGSQTYSNTVAVATSCKGKTPQLYPNPAKDQVKIAGILPGNIIRLYDPMGRLLYTRVADKTTEVLNLAGFAAGTYNVVVMDNNTVLLQVKLVHE